MATLLSHLQCGLGGAVRRHRVAVHWSLTLPTTQPAPSAHHATSHISSPRNRPHLPTTQSAPPAYTCVNTHARHRRQHTRASACPSAPAHLNRPRPPAPPAPPTCTAGPVHLHRRPVWRNLHRRPRPPVPPAPPTCIAGPAYLHRRPLPPARTLIMFF